MVETKKVIAVETSKKYCRFCGEMIPEGVSRVKHESKCGTVEARVDYRSMNAPKNRKKKYTRAKTVDVCFESDIYERIKFYKIKFFTSIAELVRAALLDWRMHHGTFNDEPMSLKCKYSTSMRISMPMLEWMDTTTSNHSALIRAAVERYIINLEGTCHG
jgi:hypothetical protein